MKINNNIFTYNKLLFVGLKTIGSLLKQPRDTFWYVIKKLKIKMRNNWLLVYRVFLFYNAQIYKTLCFYYLLL